MTILKYAFREKKVPQIDTTRYLHPFAADPLVGVFALIVLTPEDSLDLSQGDRRRDLVIGVGLSYC